MKRKTLKWILSLFLSVAMIFAATGCSPSDKTVAPTDINTPEIVSYTVTVITGNESVTKTIKKGRNTYS